MYTRSSTCPAAGLRKNKPPREVTLSCVLEELMRVSEKDTEHEHCTNYSIYCHHSVCTYVSVTFNCIILYVSALYYVVCN